MKNKCSGKVFKLKTKTIRYYDEVLNERIIAVHKETLSIAIESKEGWTTLLFRCRSPSRRT